MAASAGWAVSLWLLCLLDTSSALRPVQQEPLSSAIEQSEALSLVHKTMQELVVKSGYPLEEHFVETADGYVLGVYRIPGSRESDAPGTRRPPVLLQHGLLDCSATWVLNDPDQSLGFILADAGWDVWMGNSRGNAFSRNHTGIDPSTAAFWQFSFDDMAQYDLPAVLDYISVATGYQQVAYVGHSQGTTQMFAALSDSAAMRERLSMAVMLAPAVYLRFVTSVPAIALASIQMDRLFNLLGSPEFLPSRRITADLFGEVCVASPPLCVSVLTAIAGYNEDNLNLTRLPEYVQYAPSGTSVKNMAHWAQLVRKSRAQAAALFEKFDYGSDCITPRGLPRTCNQRVYHSDEPPSYDVSNIVGVPLAIFSGGQDKLADPVDVESLLEALPEGAVVYKQFNPEMEHLDFTWGIHSRDAIYPQVLQVLQQHAPQLQTVSYT